MAWCGTKKTLGDGGECQRRSPKLFLYGVAFLTIQPSMAFANWQLLGLSLQLGENRCANGNMLLFLLLHLVSSIRLGVAQSVGDRKLGERTQGGSAIGGATLLSGNGSDRGTKCHQLERHGETFIGFPFLSYWYTSILIQCELAGEIQGLLVMEKLWLV